MGLPCRTTRGYSLIELVLVVTIVGILAVIGVSLMGNRKAESVRTLMDQLEGSLDNARQLAVATGHDVNVYNWGTWDTTTNNSLVLAYGDAQQTAADFTSTVNLLLAGSGPNTATPYSATVAIPFRMLANDAILTRARASLPNSDDWTTAMGAAPSGSKNADLTTLPPFTTAPFAGLIIDANLLFQGKTETNGIALPVTISGTSQRFTSSFIIEVVGTSPSSGPMAGSPMGLLVVLANGAEVYKFYNPGVLEGNGQWRRI
jgi:prepilin-type N-terminal cleavage/methylation domain-containing protein